MDLLRVQTLLELAGEDIHDLAHVLARQGVEHDHVVDAVQELGIEGPLELVMDRGLDRAELLHAALGLREAEAAGACDDLPPAQVRGHDDHRVLEIHPAPGAVCEHAVVQYLEQHVEHVRVRLLDLVEQHN